MFLEHAEINVIFFMYHSPLRAFDLVKDRDTGNSKGYGFCVYQVFSSFCLQQEPFYMLICFAWLANLLCLYVHWYLNLQFVCCAFCYIL